MRKLVLAMIAAVPMVAGVPAFAQVSGPGVPPPGKTVPLGPVSKGAPVNGVLTLYGNERCPVDRDGNEIVICERRDAAEQYRVPKDLRNFKVTPQNESWALRAQGALSTGGAGIGSCSAIGPGGGIGCSNRQFSESKATDKERDADEAAGKK